MWLSDFVLLKLVSGLDRQLNDAFTFPRLPLHVHVSLYLRVNLLTILS